MILLTVDFEQKNGNKSRPTFNEKNKKRFFKLFFMIYTSFVYAFAKPSLEKRLNHDHEINKTTDLTAILNFRQKPESFKTSGTHYLKKNSLKCDISMS